VGASLYEGTFLDSSIFFVGIGPFFVLSMFYSYLLIILKLVFR
jgi:hypothetical protein